MITKIDNRKIEHQTNIEIFFKTKITSWEKNKTNYKNQFSIRLTSIDEIEKKII
jgi:hypothetical protein